MNPPRRCRFFIDSSMPHSEISTAYSSDQNVAHPADSNEKSSNSYWTASRDCFQLLGIGISYHVATSSGSNSDAVHECSSRIGPVYPSDINGLKLYKPSKLVCDSLIFDGSDSVKSRFNECVSR